MWIKKFVLGGAALPGGLRRAVKRARGDKGGATTFTVPTHFAVLAAVLSSGFIVGLAVGLTEKGSRDSPRGWAAGTAAGSAVAASTLALAALECGIRFIGGASLSAPFSVAGCVVGSVFGVCVCGLNAQHHFVLHAFTGGLTWAIATAVAVGLEAGLRPYFGVPTSAAGAIAGCLAGWFTGWRAFSAQFYSKSSPGVESKHPKRWLISAQERMPKRAQKDVSAHGLSLIHI